MMCTQISYAVSECKRQKLWCDVIYLWPDWHDGIGKRRPPRTTISCRGKTDRTPDSPPAAASTRWRCLPVNKWGMREGERIAWGKWWTQLESFQDRTKCQGKTLPYRTPLFVEWLPNKLHLFQLISIIFGVCALCLSFSGQNNTQTHTSISCHSTRVLTRVRAPEYDSSKTQIIRLALCVYAETLANTFECKHHNMLTQMRLAVYTTDDKAISNVA